jgi:hypothetical protein
VRPEEEAELDMIRLGGPSVLDRLESGNPSELEYLRSEYWLSMVIVVVCVFDGFGKSRVMDEKTRQL